MNCWEIMHEKTVICVRRIRPYDACVRTDWIGCSQLTADWPVKHSVRSLRDTAIDVFERSV